MVGLVMGVTTLLNVILIPIIAGVFGNWVVGGVDTGSIVNSITGFFGNLL